MSLVKNFSRFIFITSDKELGTTYVPPSGTDIVNAVTDVNHSKQLASNLYTQAQIDAQRVKAFNFFKTAFGIDFAAGTFLPNGMVVKDGWTCIPYSNVTTGATNVSFDSDNLERGILGNWFGQQFGELVVAGVSGTFTGGTHAGETYNANDILTAFNYDLIRSKGLPPLPTQARETLWCYSPYVNKNIPNSQGYSDFFAKLEAVDECGRVGYFNETIAFNKRVEDGTIFTATRVDITWK